MSDTDLEAIVWLWCCGSMICVMLLAFPLTIFTAIAKKDTGKDIKQKSITLDRQKEIN